ncbi:hypothetical protein Pla110_35300 [Polystyrenella longa]|uniref:Double zinc ribbon n=1 Tax=Polystyrenella longa TaxID=2528007 RepID=A0A518CRE1_9PLAN|nr:DUF5684 domain-containing protein [Polystyrenella longa]QDU81780.1 hypothetical protein Pla110_35300 [Polystyrenella longa]
MPIKIRCKVCEAGLKLPDAAMGKVVKCPKCANRIKVPSRQPGSEGSAKPPSQSSPGRKRREAASSTGFMTALGNLPLEDQQMKICPRCGQDVDPETGVCESCGIDVETGQLTEKRKRLIAVKGVDPRDFFKNVANDFFVYPFKNFGLIGRSILISMLAYIFIAIAHFFIHFSDGLTVEIFMWAFVSVSTAFFFGWFWTIASEMAVYTFQYHAALKKKKKTRPFKPKKFDIFMVFQNGYRFLAWVICNVFVHALVLFPLILVVGFSLLASGSGSKTFLTIIGILLGFSLTLVGLSIPSAVGHMSMPVTWPGWNPFKLAQLTMRTIGQSLVWGLLTLMFAAIPIAGYAVAYNYVADDLDEVWEPMRMNARITWAQRLNPGPKEVLPDELIELRNSKANNEVDYMVWVKSEAILLPIACFAGVFLIGSARCLGNLVYYCQNSLDLIREVPGATYKVLDKKKYLPIPFRSQVGAIWLFCHLFFGLEVAATMIGAVSMGIPFGTIIVAELLVYFIVFLPIILYYDGLCRIFEKTKNTGILALIPWVRNYLQFKAAGMPGVWFPLFIVMNIVLASVSSFSSELVPIVSLPLVGIALIGNMVIWIYLNIKLAERFEKPITYGLGLAFLAPVFYFILGRSMDRAKRLSTDPPPEFDDDDLKS